VLGNNHPVINEIPTKGCLGLVLATGFDTSKGKLIRKVVSNADNLNL
jgi:magnesium-transporting ATPase (P-type)